MAKTVGVIGGTGFIGTALCRHIHMADHRCALLDRATISLTDPDQMKAFWDKTIPDAIIFSGCPPPSKVEMRPEFLSNYLASLETVIATMPETCRFLYTGSMAEFGHSGIHFDTAPRRPNTAYGFLKAAAADRVLATLQTTGKSGLVARLFGVYGPGEAPSRLIPSLISALRQRHPVPLSNGLQRRDFVHIDDVVKTLLSLALSPDDLKIDQINIGTGQAITVRDLCQNLAQVLGASSDLLQFGARPRHPHDEDMLVADVSKLTIRLGAPLPHRLGDPNFLDQLVKDYGANIPD